MGLRSLRFVDLPEHHAPGGFDHAAVHGGKNLLYVAHTANDAVDVIDCASGRFLRSVPGLHRRSRCVGFRGEGPRFHIQPGRGYGVRFRTWQ